MAVSRALKLRLLPHHASTYKMVHDTYYVLRMSVHVLIIWNSDIEFM